jgi:hypothetical protein
MNNTTNNILNLVRESDYVASKVNIEEELLNFSLQIIELLRFQQHRGLRNERTTTKPNSVNQTTKG